MNAINYVAVGPGISDGHSYGCTTMAGVAVGTDGLIILEVEEERSNRAAREYAEVGLSLDGAVKLRDLLTAAINRSQSHVSIGS